MPLRGPDEKLSSNQVPPNPVFGLDYYGLILHSFYSIHSKMQAGRISKKGLRGGMKVVDWFSLEEVFQETQLTS